MQKGLCEVADAFQFLKHVQYLLERPPKGFIEVGVAEEELCAKE